MFVIISMHSPVMFILMSYSPIIKSIRYAIRTERHHLQKSQYQDLTYMHRLRDNLKRMFNKFKPFIRLLEHIIEDETISPGPTVFLRDVLDNLENYFEVRRQPCTLLKMNISLLVVFLTVTYSVFPSIFLTDYAGNKASDFSL